MSTKFNAGDRVYVRVNHPPAGQPGFVSGQIASIGNVCDCSACNYQQWYGIRVMFNGEVVTIDAVESSCVLTPSEILMNKAKNEHKRKRTAISC